MGSRHVGNGRFVAHALLLEKHPWSLVDGLTLTGDELVGLQIVRRAIEEPMRHIASNAGAEGSIVISKVKEMTGDEGFNAATETYEDLVKAGVIDLYQPQNSYELADGCRPNCRS